MDLLLRPLLRKEYGLIIRVAIPVVVDLLLRLNKIPPCVPVGVIVAIPVVVDLLLRQKLKRPSRHGRVSQSLL